MLRFRPITDAKAASSYYGRTDGGSEYYLGSPEMRREVGGLGASMLGLSSSPDFDQFKRLLNGLDPYTGERLTALHRENRLAGWDVTASIPKGVTLAIEGGDERVHDALWEAGRETMADLELFITTRIRKGGRHEDRVTGNMIYYGFEHPETRPAKSDKMPDPDRHIHFVISNLTWDAQEEQWKAIKFRPIMDLRKWFDRRFDLNLAGKLSDLGYSVETKYKQGRYYSWDIKGLDRLAAKFSRRTQEVDELAGKLGVDAPTRKDKLGATSRLHKREGMTLADYREYWNARMSPREKGELAWVIQEAKLGMNPRPVNGIEQAARYAIGHEFERRSVLPQKDLEITVMERAMGAAKPEDVLPELKKQGVLLKDGQATTREVLAQEGRIIDFAREGKGTMRPLRADIAQGDSTDISLSRAVPSAASSPHIPQAVQQGKIATLSAEQQALIQHVLTSTDQVVLVQGDAGTGKTTAIKPMFRAIDKPIEMLAPSASASRGVLREEGFSRADTVRSFLDSEERQQAVNNGVIWVDEFSLLAVNDLESLMQIAKEQHARLVLQGDPKQHRSVARDGNMMKLLEEYAGLKVGRLTEIWRQKNSAYKEAVAAIARGDILGGHERLEKMGAVKHGLDDIAGEYVHCRDHGLSTLVVAPTHREGDAITTSIRGILKRQGKLGEDITLSTLRPLHWTDAQKADPAQYDGTEVVQFHRNSGPYRAGQRIGGGSFLRDGQDKGAGDRLQRPDHFTIFAPESRAFAPGDLIRVTHNSRDKTGKHKLDNGSHYTVASIEPVSGDITLSENNWVINTPHITHGYVSTSFGAQGKTVDVCLAAMGKESLGAINAAAFYVTASRARHAFRLYTDLEPGELKAAIKKADTRRSATEVFKPKKKPTNPHIEIRKRVQEHVRRLLIEQQHSDMNPVIAQQERSVGYDR